MFVEMCPAVKLGLISTYVSMGDNSQQFKNYTCLIHMSDPMAWDKKSNKYQCGSERVNFIAGQR
jgi:hypothetical protein